MSDPPPQPHGHTFTRLELLLLSLTAGGGLAALGMPWLPIETSLSHFVSDDCFYYLGGARHYLRSGLVSLDGSHPTNGFHPLWMVFSILVSGFVGSKGAVATTAILTLSVLAWLGTLTLVYALVRRLSLERTLALAVVAFMATNYRLLSISLTGLEAALQGLLLVACISLLLTRGFPRTALRSLELGGMLGLLALTRLDMLLFVAVVLGWMFVRGMTSEPLTAIRLAAVTSLTVVVLLTPWFAFSWKQSGVLLPNSKAAIEAWSVAATSGVEEKSSGSSGLLERGKSSLRRFVTPANDLANLLGVWPVLAYPRHRFLAYSGCLVLLICVLLFLLLAWAGRTEGFVRHHFWLLLWGLAHVGYYLYFGSISNRYLYPALLGLAIFAAGAWASSSSSGRGVPVLRQSKFVLLILLVMTAGSLAGGVQSFGKKWGSGHWHGLHACLYRAAAVLGESVPPQARVGSFNAGIIGYFSGRTTVNLDGVFNDSVIPFIRQQELSEYLKLNEIDYLVDVSAEIGRFMNRFSGHPGWRGDWEETSVVTCALDGGPGTVSILRRRKPN